jgi:hypothetical protein
MHNLSQENNNSSTHAAPTLEELWRRASLHGMANVHQGEVDRCARAIAGRARTDALTPEQMLALIKQSWNDALAPLVVTDRDAAQAVLDTVISASIAHFFKL